MPGSLLLGTDAHSDVSEYSGRSLDSKVGGKKVSFNKAVRVKQYPWKPDLDVNPSEHLTLPSNRFWFKVYKNKHDIPVSYDYTNGAPKHNAWGDENMECIHDSLAPIAEVDDQELDNSPKHTNGNYLERNGYQYNEEDDDNVYNDSYKSYGFHPTDPPVDYFDDTQFTSNRSLNGARPVWGDNTKNGQLNYELNRTNISNQWNGNGNLYSPHSRIDENSHYNDIEEINGIPRPNFKSDFSTRRSLRRMDNSDSGMSRERRSRSHDAYMDHDSRFNHLKKADKSVSTEDLNFGNGKISPNNKFFIGSRDIATQCYGTLTRNQTKSPINNLNMSSASQTNSYVSNTERLKNFKTQRPKLNFPTETNVGSVSKKDYSLEKVSSILRPRADYHKSNGFSTQTEPKHKQYNQESSINSKASNGYLKPLSRTVNSISTINGYSKPLARTENSISTSNGYSKPLSRTENNISTSNGYSKPLARTENSISSIIQSQNSKPFNRFNPRSEVNGMDSKKNRENTTRNDSIRGTNSVGFLRGRQIPLSEVNTNTNRKFTNGNNASLNQNHSNRKVDENHSILKLPNVTKPDPQLSKGYQTKRYLSPPNNHERRSFRNGSNSAKSYASSYSEGDSSMIDWSLSGFQLAPKTEIGSNSMSDSEYTVHRRPPLLMYIPGVSHHNRPAIEDDRLSALSDLSRSEIYDGLSSLNGSSKDRGLNGDFRRRQSMREGKSKWLKWRSKS